MTLHRDWRTREQGFAAEAAMASRAFRPAHEHEWFNQLGCVLLRRWAESVQLNFAVVKFFTKSSFKDVDIPWLACECSRCRCFVLITRADYPDHRMLSEIGLTAGQAHDLRQFASHKLDQAEQGVDIYE